MYIQAYPAKIEIPLAGLPVVRKPENLCNLRANSRHSRLSISQQKQALARRIIGTNEVQLQLVQRTKKVQPKQKHGDEEQTKPPLVSPLAL